ncbi:hypothetical protein [Mastigocoleus testarum]|nr:hypothetical protein [Mastigocoleus testarum]
MLRLGNSGVGLSVDGTNWYRLISLTGDNSPQPSQTALLDRRILRCA